MNGEHISQKERLAKLVDESEDLAWLMRVVTTEQSSYWYEPCGRSGDALEPILTPLARSAVRRAHVLLGLGKLD